MGHGETEAALREHQVPQSVLGHWLSQSVAGGQLLVVGNDGSLAGSGSFCKLMLFVVRFFQGTDEFLLQPQTATPPDALSQNR